MKTLFCAIGLAAAMAFMSAGAAFAAPTAGDGYASHAPIAHAMAFPALVNQANGAEVVVPELFAIVGLIPDADPVWPRTPVMGVDHGIASPLPELIPK